MLVNVVLLLSALFLRAARLLHRGVGGETAAHGDGRGLLRHVLLSTIV